MDDQKLLRDLLDPADDGRAFTDAVLLRAAGALHARAAAATVQQIPALGWLENWARPWVFATLILLAVAVLLPTRSWTPAPRTVATTVSDSDAIAASLLPADLAMAVTPEGR